MLTTSPPAKRTPLPTSALHGVSVPHEIRVTAIDVPSPTYCRIPVPEIAVNVPSPLGIASNKPVIVNADGADPFPGELYVKLKSTSAIAALANTSKQIESKVRFRTSLPDLISQSGADPNHLCLSTHGATCSPMICCLFCLTYGAVNTAMSQSIGTCSRKNRTFRQYVIVKPCFEFSIGNIPVLGNQSLRHFLKEPHGRVAGRETEPHRRNVDQPVIAGKRPTPVSHGVERRDQARSEERRRWA